MKKRYFMLPFLVLSLIVLIVNSNKEATNRSIISLNREINYPFFNNKKLDNFISEYLDNYINEDNNDILIDYDYYKEKDKYYLTFYKYFVNDNILKENNDFFIIKSDSINKSFSNVFKYDFINNKAIDDNDKFIALTFDDGPNYNTNKILDVLEKYNVKATFFVLGSKVEKNKSILKRMDDLSMEIGNHTYNHLLLTKYKEDKIKDEINSTSNLIFDVIGKYPKLLRPSYGSFNNKIKKISNNPIILWDVDTLDWKYHNSKKITDKVLKNVRDGDVILMHDIYISTVNAIDNIIPILQKRGYKFVTVSELFYYKDISLEKGKIYGFAR